MLAKKLNQNDNDRFFNNPKRSNISLYLQFYVVYNPFLKNWMILQWIAMQLGLCKILDVSAKK